MIGAVGVGHRRRRYASASASSVSGSTTGQTGSLARRRIRADRPVAAVPADVGVGDAGEVLLGAHGGGGGSATRPRCPSRSSASGSYGAGCIVTSADRYSNEMRKPETERVRHRREDPRLHPCLHVVAQPVVPCPTGLVVVGVEDVVVRPERVDARARHERRSGPELEPRARHLVPDGDGTLRAVLGVTRRDRRESARCASAPWRARTSDTSAPSWQEPSSCSSFRSACISSP